MGNPGFPTPLREGQALSRAEGWGTPVSPPPCARAAPSQTLPRAEGWGTPVSPPPCARAALSQTLPRAEGWGTPGIVVQQPGVCRSQTLPRAGESGNPVPPYPCSRARPSRGRGGGETRFPHPPAQGLRPHLPAGGGMGEPGSPMFTLEPHAAAPHTKRNENQIFLGGRSPPKPSRRGGIFTFEECNLESEEELCATSAPR